jgi:hypothetical protein
MYNYENLPSEWFSSRKRPRSYHYLPPMARPVSKSFNRISDFIFPDTVHIRLQQQQQLQQQYYQRYQRNENYSLPVLNRRSLNQHDLIVVERLPMDQLDSVDFLYREQYQQQHHQHQHQQQQQQRYQSSRPVRRRYTSIANERHVPSSEKLVPGLATRSDAYRERIRDRRKRHTTDNAYHSMMKSMLEEEESQYITGEGGEPNYILSYTTTLDPITDSESVNSVQQQSPPQHPQYANNISPEEWKRQTHARVPVNGTVPVMMERERARARERSSSLSSRDSSSDTDITERHPTAMNYSHYQQDASVRNAFLLNY